MSSQVFICNLGLSNIAKPSISSIDGSEAEAVACKQFYDHVRRVMLHSYPWRFAQRTIALAGVTNDKPGRWLYAYARPADCLRFLMVTDEQMADYVPDRRDGLVKQGGFAYEIEGDVIYCDLEVAYGVYTFDLTDPMRFSPMFEEAFGWHLAVRLAMPLTRDPKIRADAYQLAKKAQGEAEAIDANETRNSSDTPSEAIEARD